MFFTRKSRCLFCSENELGLRSFLEKRGHTYLVTDDKGESLDKELVDTGTVTRFFFVQKIVLHIDILITTPFHPAYVTKERIENVCRFFIPAPSFICLKLVEEFENGCDCGGWK